MKLNFGERIKKYRRERDLTQDELAQAVGVSYQSVSKWERDEGYPDITLLPVLANYFGVTIDALLCNDRTDEEVREDYQERIGELWNGDDVEATLDYALEHYRKYPNSRYIDDYAFHVCLLIDRILEDDSSAGMREKYVPLLKEVCERNIRQSTNQDYRKFSISAMCANCEDADFEKWYDRCIDDYCEVKDEVLENRLWRQQKYEESRSCNDMNNLRIFLHFLQRDARHWALPQRAVERYREKIRVLEFFGENGEVPMAWQCFYAELHFRTACAAFGCGRREEGYAYLAKAFELFSQWFEIPDGTELSFGRKSLFGGIRILKGSSTLVFPDGKREEYSGEGRYIATQQHDLLYGCMTVPCGWEWFDSVRDEDAFKQYVEKARKLMEKYNPVK